jgi:hypothetical protein
MFKEGADLSVIGRRLTIYPCSMVCPCGAKAIATALKGALNVSSSATARLSMLTV